MVTGLANGPCWFRCWVAQIVCGWWRSGQQGFVYEIGLASVIQGSLPRPSARALATGSMTHQISDKNTFSIRPNYQYESDENRGRRRDDAGERCDHVQTARAAGTSPLFGQLVSTLAPRQLQCSARVKF
jgi:hypothetical protein